MAENLVVNGNNSIPKGSVIFEKGQPLQVVGLVVKGRVVVQGDGVRTTLGTGNFLGMYDVLQGKHSFTSIALDDCVIYGLPIADLEHANQLIEEKTQYRGLLITSINFFFQDIFRVYSKIKQDLDEIVKFVSESYDSYLKLVEQAGLMPEKIDLVQKLEKEAEKKHPLPEKLNYYVQCCRIPVEAQKNYYGANAYVAKTYFMEQCKLLPELLALCSDTINLLQRYFRVMALDDKNLFSIIGRMALSVKRAGQDASKLSVILDHVLEHINDTENILIEKAGAEVKLDRERMEATYVALMSDDTGDMDSVEEVDLNALNNSLDQILDYAPIHGEEVEEISEVMKKFEKLEDPFVRTPEANAIRKSLSKHFFALYEAIVFKRFKDNNPPLAVQLFLRYGYLSENLLTTEELQTLLSLPSSQEDEMTCRVYTLFEWLQAIHDGEKMPSKNEFDEDYETTMRKQMQEGKIDKREHARALDDTEEMVRFEIHNLVRYADRILNGNISVFVPVLCSESIFAKLENTIVTAAGINQTVNRIEKIDYSLFYRERFISLEEIGLPRFEMTERYTPDFILFPVYGRNGLMWQDLEGRQKSSHARILLPSFMEHDLPGVILKMLAHYRWERCRTEMGAQWNNFHYPSLTSEYTDYLQFYKKNSELTPDKKEKIKAQLQQCNNKHREVFTKDYQDWILREAAGATKLNRIARKIMYTYCPISDEQAKKLDLLEQMPYHDAAKIYLKEQIKKKKMLASIIHKYEKAGLEVPEEVEETRRLMM